MKLCDGQIEYLVRGGDGGKGFREVLRLAVVEVMVTAPAVVAAFALWPQNYVLPSLPAIGI